MHDQRALARVEQQVFSAPGYLADTQATQFVPDRGVSASAARISYRGAGDAMSLDVGEMPRRMTSTSGNSGMRFRPAIHIGEAGKQAPHLLAHLLLRFHHMMAPLARRSAAK